jgi:hypothetical protein
LYIARREWKLEPGVAGCRAQNLAAHNRFTTRAPEFHFVNSLEIAGIVFICTSIGAFGGMLLRGRLPEGHLDKESKELIRLASGLIGSMAALVLGLLVAAATGEFNTQNSGFQQLAANVMLLDRALAHYGPEAKAARDALRDATKLLVDGLWPGDGSGPMKMDAAELTSRGDTVYEAIQNLAPQNDTGRWIQSQALGIAAELGKTRWQLTEASDSSLPKPFLVVLTFWLMGLFLSFGLFAPRNNTVIATLLVSAASVAGAVFLVVDLDQPFEGLIQISSTPLRSTLTQLGK